MAITRPSRTIPATAEIIEDLEPRKVIISYRETSPGSDVFEVAAFQLLTSSPATGERFRQIAEGNILDANLPGAFKTALAAVNTPRELAEIITAALINRPLES